MENKFIATKYLNLKSTAMSKAAQSGRREDLINLSLGDPDLITNEVIITAAFEDAKRGHTKYTDPRGDTELISEIIKFYKEVYKYEVEPDEVLITVGACHGMFLILESVINEGEEVIIHEPYFTPYKEQVNLVGGKAVFMETLEEEFFNINADRLKKVITDNSKAIILNSPNNPTGACFDRGVLQSISEVVRDKDLFVISDEVYDYFDYENKFIPFGSLPGMHERTVTLGSFSKSYAMTGWRIGYAIGPKHIISCMKEVNEGVCFTAPSISQRAAIHALRERKALKNEIINEFKERVNYVYERVNTIPSLSAVKPGGGIYVFVNIKSTGFSSEEFSDMLHNQAGVLVIPGNSFGQCGEGYIRVACTVSIEKLKEALDRIERVLSK